MHAIRLHQFHSSFLFTRLGVFSAAYYTPKIQSLLLVFKFYRSRAASLFDRTNETLLQAFALQHFKIYPTNRPQWLSRRRRQSAADRLLGLRARISNGAYMSVLWVLCFHVDVSTSGRSLVKRSLMDCGVSLCVIQNPKNEAALARVWREGERDGQGDR